MPTDGIQPGGEERFSCDPPARVTLTEKVFYEGHESFQIDTPLCRWVYHKAGAGFAALIDTDGADWIRYRNVPESCASGWYRGIPNAVNPEDCFHPGRDTCSSVIEQSTASRVTIRSRSNDGLWQCLWDIRSRFAVLTMLKVAHDYWFQYEGTPGGRTSEGNFIVLSDGSRVAATLDGFTRAIPGEKWYYTGDPSTKKALFFASCEGNTVCDRWYRMEGPDDDPEGMIISAFGRGAGVECKLKETPRRFIVGILEDNSFNAASAVIKAALDEVRAEPVATPEP